MSFEDPAHPSTDTCDMYLEGAQDRSSAENLAQCEAEAAVLEEYKPLSKLGAFCISNPVRASLQSAAAACAALQPSSAALLTRAACACVQLLPDCPLTYCNETFQEQTGFSLAELCGRNCRFLQCAETSAEVVEAIGKCLSHFRRHKRGSGDVGSQTFRLINAKKDGTRFLNLVHMSPIYDRDGKLVRMLGCQYGLSLMAGADMQKLFQGVVTPQDFADLGGKTHEDVLKDWGTHKSKPSATPGAKENMVAHMEKLMTATVNDLIKTVDWDNLADMCNGLGKDPRVIGATAASGKGFVGKAGGPTGKAGQAMQGPKGQKRRSVA